MNHQQRQNFINSHQGSPYTNATIRKQCPECGEWFDGDETVKGEMCLDCQQNKADEDASEEE